MLSIPQSTSYKCVLKVYLSSDHISDATGKTVAVTISKNGGAFGNPNAGATNATEIANGWYYVTLDTTDTNTVGPVIVRGTSASCDNSETWVNVVKATNGGWTALPDTACTTNASLLTSGTGTAQVTTSSGQVTVATNNDKTSYRLSSTGVDDILRTALTESYNADGAAPTLSQALFLLIAALTEFSISGTTITVKKLDGSTTAATYTLDDATSPTSRTRAS